MTEAEQALEPRRAASDAAWQAFAQAWAHLASEGVFCQIRSEWRPDNLLMQFEAEGPPGSMSEPFRAAGMQLMESMLDIAATHAKELILNGPPQARYGVDISKAGTKQVFLAFIRGSLVGAAPEAGPALRRVVAVEAEEPGINGQVSPTP